MQWPRCFLRSCSTSVGGKIHLVKDCVSFCSELGRSKDLSEAASTGTDAWQRGQPGRVNFDAESWHSRAPQRSWHPRSIVPWHLLLLFLSALAITLSFTSRPRPILTAPIQISMEAATTMMTCPTAPGVARSHHCCTKSETKSRFSPLPYPTRIYTPALKLESYSCVDESKI